MRSLWLKSNAQASLLRVNGNASEAAGEPKLTPLQGADRLRVDALLAADAAAF